MAATVTGILLTGNHAARPSSGVSAGTLYSCSTHALVYQTTDTGGTWVTWATLGTGTSTTTMATDTLWDAAGDVAVGTGANTGGRLAIGAAGGALSRVNGAVAWNSGTSFPTAATGDRYWRTDIFGGLEFFYDGTRWRSLQIFAAKGRTLTASATEAVDTSLERYVLFQPTYSVYLLEFRARTHVFTTNDGTKFWTVFVKKESDNAIVTSFTTAAQAADTWTNHLTTPAAVSTEGSLYLGIAKTSTPGAILPIVMLTYQIIAT